MYINFYNHHLYYYDKLIIKYSSQLDNVISYKYIESLQLVQFETVSEYVDPKMKKNN